LVLKRTGSTRRLAVKQNIGEALLGILKWGAAFASHCTERLDLRRERGDVIDTTSAHGCLVTSILAVIGEFERELIRSRLMKGGSGHRAAVFDLEGSLSSLP
jgi:hypothetical protein